MSFPPTTKRTRILDTLEGLEMSYPKTTDERHQELLEIRKQLTT